MQLHIQIGAVSVSPRNVYAFSLVKRVDHRLLYSLILLIIECINSHNSVKNLRVLRADLRQREGNNREAPLLADNIGVHKLTHPILHLDRQAVLLCRQRKRFLCFHRRKRHLAKHFLDSRSRMSGRLLCPALKRRLHRLQTPLYKFFVQIQR